MSILVGKNTKVLIQNITNSTGSFHTNTTKQLPPQ